MNVHAIGKFLDQPLLSNSISRKMPAILTGSALLFGIEDTLKQPKEERAKRAKRNAIILGTITASTILSAKYLKIKGENLIDFVKKEDVLKSQTQAIDEFLKKSPQKDEKTLGILEKAKEKMLNIGEVSHILDKTKNDPNSKQLTDALFGEDKNINSKEIFKEISKLSTMGFIPVASGVAGGLVADAIEGDLTKDKAGNKVKEGIYQFFANIFLCNVGAGSFLYTAEKLQEKGLIKKLSKVQKTGVILAGILSVGVLGGSCIANCIGNKVINPVINKLCKKDKSENVEEKRKPEPLDIALHTDDIATAGVLSGVKWIEPLLPVMYLVSGYRSAIGYRNSEPKTLDKNA